jgi:hypothetical protein
MLPTVPSGGADRTIGIKALGNAIAVWMKKDHVAQVRSKRVV